MHLPVNHIFTYKMIYKNTLKVVHTGFEPVTSTLST